jgi:hypothetical protein
MLSSASPACVVAAHWSESYAAYQAAGGRSVNEAIASVMTAPVGQADASGNVVGDGASCFPVNRPQPDPVIAAGSACVDGGVAGARLDGSTPTLDITGGPRVEGAAADVGCYERP